MIATKKPSVAKLAKFNSRLAQVGEDSDAQAAPATGAETHPLPASGHKAKKGQIIQFREGANAESDAVPVEEPAVGARDDNAGGMTLMRSASLPRSAPVSMPPMSAPPDVYEDDVYFEDLPDFEEAEEEVREEILSQAQYTAELCLVYEESSVKQSRALNIPKAICEHLTQTAQALTAFASNAADTEVVMRVLKASPAEVTYDENSVNALREEKLDQFVKDVASHLETISTKQPGIIRLEARERFMKKLRTALMLCITKHDQVVH